MSGPQIIPVPPCLRYRQRRATAAMVLILLGGFAGLLGLHALEHRLYRPGLSPTPLHDPIRVNTADAATLCLLPGVGPSIAQRIIAHRRRHRLRQPADLEAISHIGPKTRRKIAPWIQFDRRRQLATPPPWAEASGHRRK